MKIFSFSEKNGPSTKARQNSHHAWSKSVEKWELVKHQRQVDEGVVANPSEYLEKLAAYIGDKKMIKKVSFVINIT